MSDDLEGDLLACGHYEGYNDIEEGCLMCKLKEASKVILELVTRSKFLVRKWTEAEKHIADTMIQRNEAREEVEKLKKQIQYLEGQVSAARMDAFLGGS